MTELAYVLVTPYSLLKSRTGGILGRVLALSGTELIGARLYTPSDKMVDEYCKLIEEEPIDAAFKKALVSYVNDSLRKTNKLGIGNRTLLLIFEGEDAIAKIKNAVGSLHNPLSHGDTVRGTYGDLVSTKGEIKYFEPAVLVGTDYATVKKHLALFAKYANSDGGVLEHLIPAEKDVETSLVILKPDNFKPGSSRPGNIIDMFSRTGLSIVGCRLLRLSVAQAEEFYGPLVDIFRTKLRKNVSARVREMLATNFEFPISNEMIESITDQLKDTHAKHEFFRIVRYMSGCNPYTVTAADRSAPGADRCFAILYRGENAIQKIRTSLGSTNPTEAAPGTVRSVYGNDLMRNGAHASDSPASAERERKIIGLWQNETPSEIEKLITSYVTKG